MGGLLLTEKNGSSVVSASPVLSASICKSGLSVDVCCWLHVAVELAVKPASVNSNAQTYFVNEAVAVHLVVGGGICKGFSVGDMFLQLPVYCVHFSVNAPFKPEVTGATDTSNFDVDDTEVKHTVSSWEILAVFLIMHNCGSITSV